MSSQNVIITVDTEKDDDKTTNKKNMPSRDENKWNMVIANATTGRIMHEDHYVGTSATVCTTGWPSGIYAVKVIAGDRERTEKFAITR